MLACRRLMQGLAVTGILAGTCFAQRETPNFDRNPEQTHTSEQTHTLWRISWETEKASKQQLLENFIKSFPNHESIGWVYDQYYALLVENKDNLRAMAVSEKILALDPSDIEIAYASLKMAEEKKDPVLLKSWTQIATTVAKKALASCSKDSETGKRRLDLAPQVLTYIDYLTYAEIWTTTDRAKRVELIDGYLKSHPASSYKPVLQRVYFATWRELDPVKALGIAEKMVEKDTTNEEALIMVAESYAQREREPEKVLALSEKILALMEGPKPEGVSDAEWAKKKPALSGRANWLIGSLAMQQNRYGQADRHLRAALPALRGDGRVTATALFFLGWANYKMGNIPEALRFTQECSQIKSKYQEQAIKNLNVIRAENSPPPHQQ